MLPNLTGDVNSQNTRLWPSERPYTMHERPLHSAKIEFGVLQVGKELLAQFSSQKQ